jgi:ABC-type phosphate/phosphonate transport system substrate-binding protein
MGVDERDARAALEVWLRKVSTDLRTGFVPQAVWYDTPESVCAAAAAGDVDAFAMSCLEYLRHSGGFWGTPDLCGVSGGRTGRSYLLLVRREDGISDLADLRGKNLAVETGSEVSTPLLWLDVQLMKAGHGSSTGFFGRVSREPKASRAALPVFFGQADACLVTEHSFETIAELNPQVGEKLRVLSRSPEFPWGVLCFRKGPSQVDRTEVMQDAMEMHLNPQGRQALMLWKSEKLVPYKPAYIRSLKQLVEDYDRLKAALSLSLRAR